MKIGPLTIAIAFLLIGTLLLAADTQPEFLNAPIKYSGSIGDRMEEVERLLTSNDSFAANDIQNFIVDTFSQYYLSSSFNWRFKEKGFDQLQDLAKKHQIDLKFSWKKLPGTLLQGMKDPSNLSLAAIAVITIAGTTMALLKFSAASKEEEHSQKHGVEPSR
jgi:hypothetical protein